MTGKTTGYNEKKLFPQILAVDFDGTLVSNKFPEIGTINTPIWSAVKAYQNLGWKIILWTCRSGEHLQAAVNFCEGNGLTFDAVNENLPAVQEYFGGDTRKVFANMYLDDRSACVFMDPAADSPVCFTPVGLIIGTGVAGNGA